MKTKLTLLFLLFASFAFGQFRDLANLAEGTIVFHDVLYDSNDQLYGYLYIYERDVNDKTTTMEYVLLDKNLNKVSNQVFKSNVFNKVSSNYYDCTMMGDYIILNKYYYYSNLFTGHNPLLTTFQSISIKENTVSAEYEYKNNIFTELTANFENMKSDYKAVEKKTIIRAFSNHALNGFYILEDVKNKEYQEKDLRFFNEKREQIWSYQYNKGTNQNRYQTFFFVHTKDTTLYICVVDWKKEEGANAKAIEYKIVALNLLTGKPRFEYVLENEKSEYKHSLWAKEINGNLTLIGNYCRNKTGLFVSTPNLGFYRTKLDTNGKEIEKKYTKWEEYASQININKKAKIDDKIEFRLTRPYFFKNGNITIMTEKYRIGNGFYAYSDFVLFNMKPDFSLDTVMTINKGAGTYGANFLFSQYIKDDSGIVFFHREVIDGSSIFSDKSFSLGINTLIDGQLSVEKIPLSQKKKFFIRPYPAKEGYIMLREFNEKEKYNQVRLEKLNY